MFYNLKALTVASIAFVIIPALGQQLGLDCTTGQTPGSCGQSFFTTFCSSVANQVVGLVIPDAKSRTDGYWTPGVDPARRLNPTLLHRGVGLEMFVVAIYDTPLARILDYGPAAHCELQDCETALNVVSLVCAEGGSAQFAGGAFQFFGRSNTGPCSSIGRIATSLEFIAKTEGVEPQHPYNVTEVAAGDSVAHNSANVRCRAVPVWLCGGCVGQILRVVIALDQKGFWRFYFNQALLLALK
ncbi:hypothetical protein B0H19DRAFT_1058702 [Mycena capillaripes]|nr:hypothetical protein B0H19DRAFT_1058702 [Mycena capillaripes]